MPIRIPIIAITTSSSTKVKPSFFRFSINLLQKVVEYQVDRSCRLALIHHSTVDHHRTTGDVKDCGQRLF